MGKSLNAYHQYWKDNNPPGDDCYFLGLPSKRRMDGVLQWGYAVPSAWAIKQLKKYGPFVEIGAGLGYWAQLLAEEGIEVRCYDNFSFNSEVWHAGMHHHKIRRGCPKTLKSVNPKYTLLLIWPYFKNCQMAVDSLKYYRGDTVVYVGEAKGGCTGGSAFHNRLRRDWDLVSEITIPKWEGMNDKIYVYKRKTVPSP